MGQQIGPQAPAARIIYGDTLPASCSVGQVFIVTSGSVGMYVCLSTDTWTLLDAGPDTGEVTGGGTTNRLTKWINGSGSIIGDSALLDNGVTVTSIRPITAPSLTLGIASSATGALKLANASSANLTTIQAGNAAAARTYIWPTNFGSAGSALTDAAGDGTLSWASSSGGANTVTTSILLSSTTVNLNEGTGAKQPLYTCPASRRAILTGIVVQKFSANPSTFAATMGWNAGATGVVSDSLSGGLFTSTTKAAILATPAATDNINLMFSSQPIGTAGDVLGLSVATPEGSALTAIVDVYGYLTDTSGVPIANVNGTGDGATIAPANITGTTTNNNASTGAVGELLTASRAAASATGLSTGTAKTIISVSLTAGDWDVFGSVSYIPAATTTTAYVQQGASQTDNTLGGEGTFSACSGGNLSGTILGSLITENIPTQRISLASTTTVYLIGNSSFAISTMTAYGSIFARRRR